MGFVSNLIYKIPFAAAKNYGYLYNWFAVNTANFVPTGWHVPTNTEFTTLTTYLGGLSVAGGKMKESGYARWASPNTGADNSSDFTARPGSFRDYNGNFNALKYNAYFWASTSYNTQTAWHRYLNYTTATVSDNYVDVYQKRSGLSIRLIKDDSSNPGTLTDYDGNIYDCITIGTQVWTKQNWKCTKLTNGTPLTKVTSSASWTALTTEGYCSFGNDDSNV